MKAYELAVSTAMFYGVDPEKRAKIEGAGCAYRVGEKACAIGRFMTDRQAYAADALNEGNSETAKALPEYLIPEELKEINRNFLTSVQVFHDESMNWDEKGLSEVGRAQFKSLLNEARAYDSWSTVSV